MNTVLLDSVMRTGAMWVALWGAAHLTATPELNPVARLGLAGLIAGAQWLCLDMAPLTLPPLGRALETLLAVTAMVLVALHHLMPHLSQHRLLMLSGSLACSAAAFEWIFSEIRVSRIRG
ncbi:MAG: hypothetical protein OWU84_14790 [Firmicutes bacterium]|nr:hypothetical protein [Bacillota bacterium]